MLSHHHSSTVENVDPFLLKDTTMCHHHHKREMGLKWYPKKYLLHQCSLIILHCTGYIFFLQELVTHAFNINTIIFSENLSGLTRKNANIDPFLYIFSPFSLVTRQKSMFILLHAQYGPTLSKMMCKKGCVSSFIQKKSCSTWIIIAALLPLLMAGFTRQDSRNTAVVVVAVLL